MAVEIDEFEPNDEELDELRQLILQEYGYDFSGYARSSQKRRIAEFMRRRKIRDIREIFVNLSHREFFENLIAALVISTTEFFRDPGFFIALKREVIPMLRTYPHFKIWHAGCSTGEEPFSLAILLKEEGLLDRAVIYATDINKVKVARAKQGLVSSLAVKYGSKNYFDAGGQKSLASYFTSKYDQSSIDPDLLENITFGEHNLATDASFGEMNLILCRNVLIYFTRELQETVLRLFLDSLVRRGYLGLGSKESLALLSLREQFEVIDANEKIFRRR